MERYSAACLVLITVVKVIITLRTAKATVAIARTVSTRSPAGISRKACPPRPRRSAKKLAKAIRENRGAPLNHTGDYTVAQWCRLRFGTYSKPNIRYNTAKGYEGIIEHHIIPAIGVIKLKQISSIHIQSIMT